MVFMTVPVMSGPPLSPEFRQACITMAQVTQRRDILEKCPYLICCCAKSRRPTRLGSSTNRSKECRFGSGCRRTCIRKRSKASSCRSVAQPGTGGECIRSPEILVVFPDGSFRRPDLSVFCQPPSPKDGAIETIPAAVVEVVSAESREEDMKIGPPFYLKHASSMSWWSIRSQRTSLVHSNRAQGRESAADSQPPVRQSY